jgi:hypothetical protein
LGFVYSYGGTSILIFISTTDFFFNSIFGGGGGDHGPSRSGSVRRHESPSPASIVVFSDLG